VPKERLLTGADLLQGTIGPEVDGGSQDMRETWMLLEYADRGNLDRALVQKKMMTADNCLDLVNLLTSSHPKCILCRACHPLQATVMLWKSGMPSKYMGCGEPCQMLQSTPLHHFTERSDVLPVAAGHSVPLSGGHCSWHGLSAFVGSSAW